MSVARIILKLEHPQRKQFPAVYEGKGMKVPKSLVYDPKRVDLTQGKVKRW